MRSNLLLSGAFCAGFLLCSNSALAATLCVSSTGSAGCYSRIADAVNAAAPGDTVNIGPGTYAEGVTILKPLSLSGSGATIDAAGRMVGIFVNGLAAPGLNAVHISGLTVKNANLEGILVLNASAVTVAGNTVTNNNLALVNGVCTMLPAFEPGELQDCGEGIHLQAVDHSVVTNNIITGNSGGILVSDDTGATHDNLISFNTVNNNPYACGISLASHVQAAASISLTPLGVYHNTVYGNRSQRNGYGVGGGAGIGIFASVPGTQAYGNVVVNNLVSENGHPGISLHAHAPAQNLTDNMIVANTVVNNGADTGDAMTPGPTGINLYSLLPAAGNMILSNSIQGELVDVGVKDPALVQVHFNSLNGSGYGVYNLGVVGVDATSNWWSCPNGPTLPGSCTLGSGNLQTYPWLQAPPPSLSINY